MNVKINKSLIFLILFWLGVSYYCWSDFLEDKSDIINKSFNECIHEKSNANCLPSILNTIKYNYSISDIKKSIEYLNTVNIKDINKEKEYQSYVLIYMNCYQYNDCKKLTNKDDYTKLRINCLKANLNYCIFDYEIKFVGTNTKNKEEYYESFMNYCLYVISKNENELCKNYFNGHNYIFNYQKPQI